MLSATRVSVAFGAHDILSDVSLTVRPGELCALLGRNGAGKSTLLSVLAGDVTTLANGSVVTLDGIDLADLRPMQLAQRRAVLRQAARFAFAFKVEDAIRMGRYPYGDRDPQRDRAIVAEAMALTGIESLGGRDVQTLSGGELARVQFARALVQIWPDPAAASVPRYLLLDEPTAALDIAQQHRLLEIVRTLAGRWGIGVVAILHDLNLASRYADTLAMLANGRIVAQGPPWDTLTPAHVDACFSFRVQRVEDAARTHAYVMPA